MQKANFHRMLGYWSLADMPLKTNVRIQKCEDVSDVSTLKLSFPVGHGGTWNVSRCHKGLLGSDYLVKVFINYC